MKIKILLILDLKLTVYHNKSSLIVTFLFKQQKYNYTSIYPFKRIRNKVDYKSSPKSSIFSITSSNHFRGKPLITLRTGASVCQRLNWCQIRIDGACISLIAASAGGGTGRNRASRQRPSRVSASSVVPEWCQAIAFASIRLLLLDRALVSILLPIVLQYLKRLVLFFRHNIIGYNNVHAVLRSWLFGHSVIRLRFGQFGMELTEYGWTSMRYQTQTLLQCRWYVAGRRKYHVIGIAIASTS